ncbi:MAG: biopolymer transporter ExbD [Pseudomonadota bacterium]
MKLGSRRVEEPEINLISLIDVLLMMLIFFMVSSSFISEGRLKIVLPTASGERASATDAKLVVTVTQQGTYRVNDRELINSSRETLRAAIVKVAGSERSARVAVRADARATHQAVVTAMDVLGRLGFAEINIATVDLQTAAHAPASRVQP